MKVAALRHPLSATAKRHPLVAASKRRPFSLRVSGATLGGGAAGAWACGEMVISGGKSAGDAPRHTSLAIEISLPSRWNEHLRIAAVSMGHAYVV